MRVVECEKGGGGVQHTLQKYLKKECEGLVGVCVGKRAGGC